MAHGEGSSKQVDHSDTISPMKSNIDEVFRDFWTVGEMIKEVVSTHQGEVESQSNLPRREIREILVGSIAHPIDRGPPRFNAIPERSRTMPFPMSEATLMPPLYLFVIF